MSTHPPLRHVREIVGVFVLAALALVLMALVAVGRGRSLFEQRATLDVHFEASRTAALRPGVPVKLTGEVVGTVESAVRDGARIRARLSLLRSARDLLREDTRATLRVPLAGLVGELFVELDPGGAAAPLAEGALLEGIAEGDPAVKAREAVEQIRAEVPEMLARTRSILERTDALLGQVQRGGAVGDAGQLVRSMDRLARAIEREEAIGHAARVLQEAELLLKGAREGRGTAGRLLNDPALYDRTAALLEDLHGSWVKVDALMGASARVADRAAELADRARGRGAELEVLFGQVQVLLLQANRALDLANEHWLLRSAEPKVALPVPPALLDLPAEAPAAPAGPAPSPGPTDQAPAPSAEGRP